MSRRIKNNTGKEIAYQNILEVKEQWGKIYPSEQSLEKALFLGIEKITKKWGMKIRDWGQIFGELSIMFEGRL